MPIYRALLAFVVTMMLPSLAAAQWPELSAPPAVAKSGGADVAVIVAVEDYLLLPDVTGAVRNANDWELFLRQGLGVGNVSVLANTNATREEMLKFAKKAADNAGPNSTVWWVFIGHGAPTVKGDDGLLVGMDAQQTVESLEARGLPQRELLATLEKGKQRNTVVLVDACFSGRSGTGTALAAGVQPVVPVKLQPKLEQSTVVLTAAKATEVAGQLPGTPRPAFSYLVLGALRGWAEGGDKRVTAAEAVLFAERELRNVKGRQQTPQIRGKGEIVLASNAVEPKPEVKIEIAAAVCPAGQMKTEDTAGHCCWPGQAWSQSQATCIGQPTACPPGMGAGPTGCIGANGAVPTQTTPVATTPQVDWSNDPRVADYLKQRFVPHPYANRVTKDGVDLRGREVYEALGRPDLAAKWKSWSPGTVIAGGILTAVGTTMILIGGATFNVDDGPGNLLLSALGISFAGAGVIGLIMAPFLDSHPIKAAEFHKLVRSHNDGISDEMGLPRDIDAQLKTSEVTWRIGPSSPYAVSASSNTTTVFSIGF